MATQQEVARKAHVSFMTVSRVVNNLPNVREETRRRVLKAIQDLGYAPNSAARILTGGKTKNVGIIFPREEYIVTRPYFVELSIKLERRLAERGYHLFLGSIRNESGYPELHELMAEKKVDGLVIFAPAPSEPSIALLKEANVPFVVIHGRNENLSVPSVDTDNLVGTQLMLNHLFNLGHRCIGFVSGLLKEFDAVERRNAYREYLASHDMPTFDGLEYSGDWSIQCGYDAFVELYAHKSRPTAVFFSNDQMALGAIKAAYDKGIRIPEDVSITGYDDITYARFSTPSLTTVRQSFDAIAQAGVDLILDQIGRMATHSSIVLQPTLVARDSTGPARQE